MLLSKRIGVLILRPLYLQLKGNVPSVMNVTASIFALKRILITTKVPALVICT